MVLCFGLMTKTVLITQGFLAVPEQCLHSIKAFLVFHAALPASTVGVHKNLGGNKAVTADPS